MISRTTLKNFKTKPTLTQDHNTHKTTRTDPRHSGKIGTVEKGAPAAAGGGRPRGPTDRNEPHSPPRGRVGPARSAPPHSPALDRRAQQGPRNDEPGGAGPLARVPRPRRSPPGGVVHTRGPHVSGARPGRVRSCAVCSLCIVPAPARGRTDPRWRASNRAPDAWRGFRSVSWPGTRGTRPDRSASRGRLTWTWWSWSRSLSVGMWFDKNSFFIIGLEVAMSSILFTCTIA